MTPPVLEHGENTQMPNLQHHSSLWLTKIRMKRKQLFRLYLQPGRAVTPARAPIAEEAGARGGTAGARGAQPHLATI